MFQQHLSFSLKDKLIPVVYFFKDSKVPLTYRMAS